MLTPLTGETFELRSANVEDHARVDVAARGVWIKGSRAFCDVRVFNPLAPTYQKQTLKAAHISNEKAKKREYSKRVRDVEHGSFTPLVFSCFGGMSIECSKFYNRVSDLLSDKRNISGSLSRSWIRTKLSFSLLKTANLCIRGSKTSRPLPFVHQLTNTSIKLAAVDAMVDVV